MERFENSFKFLQTPQAGSSIHSHETLELENLQLKTKLKVLEEVLKRFKLNDVSELVKEIKDLQNCLSILKADSEIQAQTISSQQLEIEKLKQLKQGNSLVPERDSLSILKYHLEQSKENIEKYRKLHKTSSEDSESLTKQSSSSEFCLFQNKTHTESLDQTHLFCSRPSYPDSYSKKEEPKNSLKSKYTQLLRKFESLSLETEQKQRIINELEADKRKLLEKWQQSIRRTKSEESSKYRVKELEDKLEAEKKRAEEFSLRLKEKSDKLEELKDSCVREKKTASELNLANQNLITQYKLLADENIRLSALTRDINTNLNLANHPRVKRH